MSEFQIPRNSLAWLLSAQAVVIAPHVVRLTVWILLVCVVCGVWRIMVYYGLWSYPSRWVKVLFVVIGLIGVPIGYGSIIGLEPAVGLLVVAFVLKLLEMQHKRDAFVVICLAYFVSITEFLFDQTIPITIYMGLVFVTITTALIGLNQTQGHLNPVKSFQLSAKLLGQSLPLMIVLFIFFPRITPLWTVPLQSQTAKTGVTDSMSPGDISRLTQSDELAFRATFRGEAPPHSQLYWRGLVLGAFDGKTWTQEDRKWLGLVQIEFGDRMNARWDSLIERRGREVSYRIILERTNQHWVFALATPVPHTDRIGLVRDYRLYSLDPIQKRLPYDVTSYLEYRIERNVPRVGLDRLTRFPPSSNPRTQALARSMYANSNGPEDFIAQVLNMFNQQNFVYTLEPELLGRHAIDEFLLDSQRGFCEHYAGSFVFMMRAAGLPARVIVGYQGGEYNPRGNYVAVRQFDAHAWAEVWLEGEGWRRIDPTSAVAPERIEDGIEAALEDEEGFLSDSPLSWLKFRQTLWLTEVRLQLQAISHYWDSWVVGYNPQTQIEFLNKFIDDVDAQKMGIALLGLFGFILAILAAIVLSKKSSKTLDPIGLEYFRFCRLLEQQGLAREIGEGPRDYYGRIAAARPDLAEPAATVTDTYVDLQYGHAGHDQLQTLKSAVDSLRLKAIAANV